MNILFVNYGDFTTNSLNHIGGFANTLSANGHACAVAVNGARESLIHVRRPIFIPATCEEVLAEPRIFPDRRTADIIHAWTPREPVRKFVVAHQRGVSNPARVIVHLEDNEQFLLESYSGKAIAELRALDSTLRRQQLTAVLSHPTRHETFLLAADGVTQIIDRLREFAPAGTPTHTLLPGVDFSFYGPRKADPARRKELGLDDDEKVVVFTGSNTFANEGEVRELYAAIAILNQRGMRTRLVRTGFNSPQFLRSLSPELAAHVIDLGFVEKDRLPDLLGLADVLVQPGRPGAFNDYRLPSKLPEFLASGKPVILPATNLALMMRDGREAVFLQHGSPEEIADKCTLLFRDPTLREKLGQHGAEFARRHFDLEANTRGLLGFYATVLDRPAINDWTPARRSGGSEAHVIADRIHRSAQAIGPAADSLVAQTALLPQALTHLAEDADERIAEVQAEATTLRVERDTAKADHRLTQQHVQNIEGFLAITREQVTGLQKERESLQAHVASLTREIRGQREHLEQSLGQLHAANLAYQNAEQKAAALAAELERARAVMAGQERELQDSSAKLAQTKGELESTAHALAATRDLLRSRDEKLARVQSSFSWRVTAPLRALRRTFLDEPPLPLPSEQIVGSIDEPVDWSEIPATLSLRGWSLHRDGVALNRVRARVGSRVYDARAGLKRPDVARHFADHPFALDCGWQVDVHVPAKKRHALVIEVSDANGTWHVTHARWIERTAAGAHPPGSYAAWVETHDSLNAADAERIRARVASLTCPPLISVVMPVYNTPEKWLRRAIESVRTQLYPHWELCIADDASTLPHVRRVLDHYARKDSRVRTVYRSSNGHISAASNSALELAGGEFVALLDHDDELRPHALAEVAFALEANPKLEFLYSDEDKIDESGRRSEPYFKPDWNPDLLLAQNYTCHLSVFRTARLRTIGGFRVGYEGSQDWDLTLRATERLEPGAIHHIPRVLYHWRAIAGSTALQIDEKSDYPARAAEMALRDHLHRNGIAGELVPVEGRHWRLRRSLPSPPPKVSVIVPTRNSESLLRISLGSLLAKTTYPDFELIVVNNRSDDDATLRYLDDLRGQGVRVLDYDAPFNFSALNNFAVRSARGSVLAFVNNDIEVISPDWLEEMTSHALRPEIGAVGAMLYYPDDTVQHAGAILGLTGPALRDGVAGHAFKRYPRGAAGPNNRLRLVQNFSAVTAACLVIRREVFERVGGFDEQNLGVAFNDIDLCLRVLKSGHRNLWTPFAEFYHHESASRGAEDTPEKIARFASETAYMRRTWTPLLDNDPAYNPNLTLIAEDFSLAFPPRVGAW